MKDIVHKSTYMLKNPITTDNIYVFDSGLGLYFADLEFREECEDTKTGFELYEAKCLKNYTQILLSILYAKQPTMKPKERFPDLREIVDPVLFYVIWFSYKENSERKKKFFDGSFVARLTVEYEKEMKENISAMQTAEGKKERKGKSKQKGEGGKEKVFSMHTLAQHRYYTLFEENTDTLLDEYVQLIGEETGTST